jgi:hypothetical protein
MKPLSFLRSILWMICLGLGLSGRLLAQGFQLPLANGGTWGDSPAVLVANIETALKDSGFLKAVEAADGIAKGLAQGKVPAIEDLTEVVEGDVKKRVEEAVGQATDATALLALVDMNALKQLFTVLQANVTKPEQFAFTIPGGRMVVRRDLTTVSLCAVIAGPGGARVTLGMSNDRQLCGNPAERFANPTREPMVFADLAVGLAHVQARRKLLAPPPLPGPDPALSIQAAIYFKIHDDWVQLRLAGNDPQSLTLKVQFAVGVKAGFSAKIQAEVEGQIVLELTVKPTQVAVLLHDIGDILKAELGNVPSSAEALPAKAAGAYKKVFEYLRTVDDGPDEVGELALRFAADGGVGLGIWDTGINAASVGAELTLSVPLGALVSLSGGLMATQFQSALETSTQMVSLFEAMSEGRLNEAELARQLALIRDTAAGLGQGLVVSFPDVIEDIELHMEAGVYALGDIGQIADQTIPLMIVGVDIPVGQIFVDGINGLPWFVHGVSETAKAMAWTAQMAISVGLDSADRLSLGRIAKSPANSGGFIQRPRGLPPVPPTAAQWKAMAADLLDGVEFSVQMGVIKLEGASLGGLVRLAAGSYEVTSSLLEGAVRSALVGSEKPLVDALRAAPGQVANEGMDLLIFNLQNLSISVAGTLGASGTLGLEGTAGLGASIGFSAEFKTSTILLAIGHAGYDEEDGTVLVGIDLPVELSLSAGVAAGEGVEFTAEGGFTLGRSLANLTLKDWGRDLPVPAGLSIAGFELIDFTGTNRQDGTIEGSGWIVLPMGGLVRADSFSLDASGTVLRGRWSGVIELGPLGERTLANGTITRDGLAGVFNLVVGDSALKSEFLLHSSGLLFGTTTGSVNVGGVALGDIQLTLTRDGSFQGTARAGIGGVTSTSDLRMTGAEQPNINLRSRSRVGDVNAQLDLELLDSLAIGTATVTVFGQPVVFDVTLDPAAGLSGSTSTRVSTPWGTDLDADLAIDTNGVRGTGRTRILGSEFRTTNLQVRTDGRLTGSFTGSLMVEGQSLGFQSLDILAESLEGRTTVAVAGLQAVELIVNVSAGGVIGTFVNDLSLFGAGKAQAFVILSDRLEIFGEMDPAFVGFLENQVRTGLLDGISGMQALLRREQDKLAGYRRQLEDIDNRFGPLRVEIQKAKQDALGLANQVVTDAEAAFVLALRELDKAIEELANLATGLLRQQLDQANRQFTKANNDLNAALAEVNKINGAIAQLDRDFNRLNDVEKFFARLGYLTVRAGMVTARDVANGVLNLAQHAFNAARAEVIRLERLIANDNGAAQRKADKERLANEAEARLEKSRRDREAILAILANPEIDPAYMALQASREAIVKLISGAETVIARTIAALGGTAELVNFIQRSGEAALLKVDRVQFQTTVRDLGSGVVELNVYARLAGTPRHFVFVHDFRSGAGSEPLTGLMRLMAPRIVPPSSWTVSSWVDDTSTGLDPSSTLWAYHFNSSTPATVNAVAVPGLTGILPAVPGQFSVQGFVASFPGDQNVLTSGAGGSAILASNFLYGANPGTITFEGLTPGRSYRATFLSVGWDLAPTLRSVTFSSEADASTFDQNLHGNDRGIRIDHTFVATAESHRVALQPLSDRTFHLYAMALSRVTEGGLGLSDWKQDRFGGSALNPAIAGDDADPDGDEIPNFLEYALRTNPQVRDLASFGLPTPVRLADGTEARQFVLPYQATADDLVYRIRQSKDLGGWTDAFRMNLATGDITQLPGVTSTVDPSKQMITITITDLSLFAPPSFWCLTVEKP